MRRVLRFFYRGPGVVLVVAIAAIAVAGIIHDGQERQKAQELKRQVQRPLGQVKPSDPVDKSSAPKEVLLSDRRIIPGSRSEQTVATQPASLPVSTTHPGPLPALVSFYAQVSTPVPSPTP